eukprot:gene31423-6597_t
MVDPQPDVPDANNSSTSQAEEEEDEEPCGWCRWMKAGGCKAEFTTWMSCVDAVRDAGRDDVESCSETMVPLWDCMQKNSDYYAQQLESLKGRSPPSTGDQDPSEASEAEAEAGAEGGQGGKSPAPNLEDMDDITDADVERWVEEAEKGKEDNNKSK